MEIRKTFIAVFALVVVCSADAVSWETVRIRCKNPEAQKLADELYQVLTNNLTDEDYEKAIGLMEKATGIEPDNDLLWVEMAGDCWNRGDMLPKKTSAQKKARLVYFDKGLDAARKALAIKKSAGAHFWYATNLAAGGEMKGIVKSLWMLPDMIKNINASNELDPHYGHGASARFWAEVVTRVPDPIIKIAGLDPLEPMRLIEAEIEREPLYFTNRIYISHYYVRMGRKDDALAQLEFVITHKPEEYPNKAEHSNQRRYHAEAYKLWKEYTGKEYPEK